MFGKSLGFGIGLGLILFLGGCRAAEVARAEPVKARLVKSSWMTQESANLPGASALAKETWPEVAKLQISDPKVSARSAFNRPVKIGNRLYDLCLVDVGSWYTIRMIGLMRRGSGGTPAQLIGLYENVSFYREQVFDAVDFVADNRISVMLSHKESASRGTRMQLMLPVDELGL